MNSLKSEVGGQIINLFGGGGGLSGAAKNLLESFLK